MKFFSQRTVFRCVGVISLVALMSVALAGCEWFERHGYSGPTAPGAVEFAQGMYGMEGGMHFDYEPSDSPGLQVTMDFTTYHIAGQPYGTWSLNAAWRSTDRSIVCPGGDLPVGKRLEEYQNAGCAYITLLVTIDESTGIGAAWLPPEFLDIVFEEAHARFRANGDTTVWHHSPGLYLNVVPGDDTLQYYQFE